MKLIKALLFTVIAALPAIANAEDIQDPFYLPQANHFTSYTSFGFSKAKMSIPGFQFKPEQKALGEMITYGLTDSLFAYASFTNYWVDPKIPGEEKYESRSWDLGLKYRMSPADNTSLTFGAFYTEERIEKMDRENTAVASILFEFMKDHTIKPFASVSYERGTEHFSKNSDEYTFEAGAWTKIDKLSLLAEVQYDYTHDYPEFSKPNTFTSIAFEGDYALAENIAAGIGCNFLIHEHETPISSQAIYFAHVKLGF